MMDRLRTWWKALTCPHKVRDLNVDEEVRVAGAVRQAQQRMMSAGHLVDRKAQESAEQARDVSEAIQARLIERSHAGGVDRQRQVLEGLLRELEPRGRKHGTPLS